MPHRVRGGTWDLERGGRRLIWLAWLIVLGIAGILYAVKAAEERSAFVRWRHQVHEFWVGTNIWDRYVFPNPPIMPICLSPLMALPPVLGALAWFAIKAGLATLSLVFCFRMARGEGGRPWPWWGQGLVLLLSLRSLLSDLNHGNINILILFLIVATLAAWRKGYDVLAGLALALAVTIKVTPALFVPYFLYKRSWRAAGATVLGLGVFFLIVPSIVLGPTFNGQCLAMWWHRMLSPYIAGEFISPQEVNQSLGGVLTRLLVELPKAGPHGYAGVRFPVNVVSWAPEQVTLAVKVLSFALVALLAFLCRTRADRRDDPRLLGEFALVVLTMLFASERTWKHHYVTLMLPYTYLVYRAVVIPPSRRVRAVLGAALALSALFIATTSEIGRAVDADQMALAYGMFFWGGVTLYLATAWRVRAERDGLPEPMPGRHPSEIPSPHFQPQPARSPS